MMFSILIPTLHSRKAQFEQLTRALKKQISDNQLENQVEILDFPDNGELTIGHKRNELIKRAQGEFIAFVDDDDDLNPNYLKLICKAIRENPEIDCIGFKGQITFSGKMPREFSHSIQYKEYFSQNGSYFRPPYHLNPIRRSIAQKYTFEEIDYSEDIDWAIRICKDSALKKECMIEETLYFYNSRRHWFYQWAIDKTETIRHALGLQLANRLKIIRWFDDNLKSFRFLKFAAVGLSGILVNLGMLYFLTEITEVRYELSGFIAIELSILTNFFLNTYWTWSDRQSATITGRLLKYHAAVLFSAFGVNWTLLLVLTNWLGLHYMISDLIGIAAGMVFNFVVSDVWVFKESNASEPH